MIMISTVFVIVIIISKNATKNTHKLTSLLPLSLSLSEVYLSPFQNFSLSLSLFSLLTLTSKPFSLSSIVTFISHSLSQFSFYFYYPFC